MENKVNGIIEFYAHAIPYLASTREKGITYCNGNTVFIDFTGLNTEISPLERAFLLKENLRIPRGPDY